MNLFQLYDQLAQVGPIDEGEARMEYFFETIAGFLAIIVMAVALTAKVVPVRLVQRVHRGIARATQVQQELLNRAGGMQSKRNLQKQIVKSLDLQRLDMQGRRSRLRSELDTLVEGHEKQERLTELRRNSLLRQHGFHAPRCHHPPALETTPQDAFDRPPANVAPQGSRSREHPGV